MSVKAARANRRRLLKGLASLPAGLVLGPRLWQAGATSSPVQQVPADEEGPTPTDSTSAGASEPSESPPNLLLITVDSLRADHLGAYGSSFLSTPNLDRLAAEGVLVAAAYSVMPSTNPSHAALLSGTYPASNRMYVHMVDMLNPELPTLAEMLRAHGYATAGIFSWHSLEPAYSGLQRGFQVYRAVAVDREAYIEQQDQPTIHPEQRLDKLVYDTSGLDEDFAVSEEVDDLLDGKADVTTDAALRWLDAERPDDRPFFLWVHYFDPHYPYSSPLSYGVLDEDCKECPNGEMATIRRIIAELNPAFSLHEVSHLRAFYHREVAFVDQEIGRLLVGLQRRGLDLQTAVAVTGDHGESFGEHGLWLHGGGLYRNELRVPLLLSYPGHLPSGRLLHGPVSLVDVMPTLLELADVPIPDSAEGSSLLPLLTGAEQDGRRHAFAESGDGASAAIVTSEWHLIYREPAGSIELYHLGVDPDETNNLARGPEEPLTMEEVENPLRLRDTLLNQQVADPLLAELQAWRGDRRQVEPDSGEPFAEES